MKQITILQLDDIYVSPTQSICDVDVDIRVYQLSS